MDQNKREKKDEDKKEPKHQVVLEEMGTLEFYQTQDDPHRTLITVVPLYKRTKISEEEELEERVKLLRKIRHVYRITPAPPGVNGSLSYLAGYVKSLEAVIQPLSDKDREEIPMEWIKLLPELEKYQKQQ
jgi:hypothetical protein